MSLLLQAHPSVSQYSAQVVSDSGFDRARSFIGKPSVAALLLFCTYVALSLLNNPSGYLGADTGAKVYTLEIMTAEQSARPAIGYWAEELDPDGSVHPVHQTYRTEHGWVAVTTLPMLELAAPLYEIGGYRAIVLLPMLGGVAAAFAARSVARRIDPLTTGWPAYWLIGLASPIVVYALDFWEHTVGVACIVGALALLLRIVDGGPSWIGVLAGGVLGLGAVLRNEVLVYAFVAVAVVCVALILRERSLRRAIAVGGGALGGFAVLFASNALLEAVVGGLSRSSRATGAASGSISRGSFSSAALLWRRVEEGLQTSLGLVSADAVVSALLGAGVVVAIVAAVRAERRGDRVFAVVCLAAAGAVYMANAVGGLGFIPGLLVAFPLAIMALVPFERSSNAILVTMIALLALPLVYLFQYVGGAGPQWGGRYTLASAVLLGVVGLAAARGSFPLVVRGVVVLSVLVTALGLAWMRERSNGVDSFFDDVVAESESVLISRQAFLLREGGAVLVGRRWLSVGDEREFTEAIDIVRQTGEDRFSVLEWEGPAPPESSLPHDVIETERTELHFVNTDVGLVTYQFS